jgi:hypothetical protein
MEQYRVTIQDLRPGANLRRYVWDCQAYSGDHAISLAALDLNLNNEMVEGEDFHIVGARPE